MSKYNAIYHSAMVGNLRRMYKTKFGTESHLQDSVIFDIAEDNRGFSTAAESDEATLEGMKEQEEFTKDVLREG